MKLIFEYEESITGYLPDADVGELSNGKEGDLLASLPAELIRKELPLPNVSEVDVIRHYTNMSRKNFGIDNGF